jgi:hypothetical protein
VVSYVYLGQSPPPNLGRTPRLSIPSAKACTTFSDGDHRSVARSRSPAAASTALFGSVIVTYECGQTYEPPLPACHMDRSLHCTGSSTPTPTPTRCLMCRCNNLRSAGLHYPTKQAKTIICVIEHPCSAGHGGLLMARLPWPVRF